MSWYAASVIMLFEYKDRNQNNFPVWENVYLIEADNETIAMEKAIRYGKEDEGDDSDSLMVGDRKAKRVFKGIRKLIEVVNLHSEKDVPSDGAEITFSDFLLDTKEDLDKLVKGNSLWLTYNE